jgi:hypothetical protein
MAPDISMERRQGIGMGMPRPSSTNGKISSEEESEDTETDEDDKIEHKLPRNRIAEEARGKRYSIIDPDVELDTDATEESEK